jgi:preprotein translocase subunit SecD
MAKEKAKKVLVVTPPGTAAYAFIHKKDTEGQYATKKFKVTIVADGDADVSEMRSKSIEAFRAKFPNVKIKDDEIKMPFKSGDDHKNEEFRGKILIDTKSEYKPDVRDTKRQPLKKGVQVRSGDVIRAVVNLFPYEQTEKVREGKKTVNVTVYGVSAQLNLVQLIEKRSGGGGVDLLDEVEGFTNDDYDAPVEAEEEETDDASDDADY